MKLARWIGFAAVVVAVAAAAGAGNASPPAATFLVEAWPINVSDHLRLEVIDANGNVLRVLSQNAGNPVVSPSKQLVAYETTKGLAVEGIDGSDRHIVIPAHMRCGHRTVCESSSFVWSPDNTRLLVSGFEQKKSPFLGYNHLSVVSVATGKSHRIIGPRYETRYIPLGWSDPAAKIAYISAHPSYQPSLVLANPDGRSRQTLCSATCGDPQDDPEIGWSPDGQWLVYTTLNYHDEIYDVTSGTTTDVAHVGAPMWTSDSNSFAAETGTGVKFFSPAGDVVETTSVTGDAYFMSSNADGVYYVTNEQPRSLFVIPTGQTTAQTVFTLPSGQAILSAQPLQ